MAQWGRAGGGARAGNTESASGATVSHAAGSVAPLLITDKVGTHAGGPITPLHKDGDPSAKRLGICDASLYGGAFTTRLGSGWYSVAARSKPCTASSGSSSWGGGGIPVSKETTGETLCRGRSTGDASSIWFKTSRGYIWSGATANPRWNRRC